MRPICYIAGPLGATCENPDVARNIKRAEALGALAVRMGYSPIVPHSYGFGVFQPVQLTLFETNEGRELALECSRDTVTQLAVLPAARLLAISAKDGTMSASVAMEVVTWMHIAGMKRVRVRTWAQWAVEAHRYDLGVLFDSLA